MAEQYIETFVTYMYNHNACTCVDLFYIHCSYQKIPPPLSLFLSLNDLPPSFGVSEMSALTCVD